MRLAVSILALSALSITAAQAQTPKARSGGPKVHTSKAKDITTCSNTKGGLATAVGRSGGMILGNKLGTVGGYGASVAGNAVGHKMDIKARCGPKAKVESESAKVDQPEKKKKGPDLGKLKGVLGF